ncbi:nuclear transport factor 2 (NTF2) superfamily protein [Bradyrhizobium sp. i1.3.1]
MSESRPPFPPFTRETAIIKVRQAEDGWNSCNPEKVALAYSTDTYLEKSGRVRERTRGSRRVSY